MKTIVLFTILSFGCLNAFGQEDTSKNHAPGKKLPPINMLPKTGEVKHIYELPEETAYQVFDSNGKLITKGTGEFIDYTSYKKGIYFVKFGKRTETFEKK